MATRTIADGGGNWNSTGTWVEGATPTASDDVVATATSGQLTINATAACRSMDLTGYTNTVTHANSIVLTIGTTTSNPSGVALKIVGTWTIGGSGSQITFSSSSASQQSITTAGNTLSVVAIGNVGSYILTDTLNANSSAANSYLTMSGGTLDTGNQNVNVGAYMSFTGAGVKTISFGSSAMTASGTRGIYYTGSNLTVSANTATMTCSAATATVLEATNATNWNGLSISHTGATGNTTIVGQNTGIKDLSMVSGKSSVFTTGALVTCTGSCTYNSASYRTITVIGDTPAVTDVRSGVAYGSSTGTLDLPAEADVKSGVQFDNLTKTGTYTVAGFGAVTSVASDDYSATYTQQITITADITGTPTDAIAVVEGKAVPMTNTSGTTWSTGAIYAGASFGAVSAKSIRVIAYKTSETPIEGISASTLTISAASEKTTSLISEVTASMTGAGYTATVTLLTEKEVGANISSLVQISVPTYSVATLDGMRTTVSAAKAGWTGYVSVAESAAPQDSSNSILIYKMVHT